MENMLEVGKYSIYKAMTHQSNLILAWNSQTDLLFDIGAISTDHCLCWARFGLVHWPNYTHVLGS